MHYKKNAEGKINSPAKGERLKKAMKKAKLFIDNFLVYGIGGVISKIVPFIMLPIITRLMPNSSYIGIYDLSNTLLQFATAIAALGMYDAMFRMFFEKIDEKFRKSVCSTALIFTVINSLVILAIMIFSRNYIAYWFFGNRQYSYLVILAAITTLASSTNGIISAPTRMQNKRKIFLITNTVSPILAYIISIPMILDGYFVAALPIGATVSSIIIEIVFGILNYKWFLPRYFDAKLLKTLLYIAIPTAPCFLAYWIFGSCDKIMITNMIGLNAAGVYSVGGRLGQISQLIYVAFAGGWNYFAFSTMNDAAQVKSRTLIFEYLGIISFGAGIFMCAWSHNIFKSLFTGDYINGYIVAPYLFLTPLLQMLYQVAGNQFLIVKKTLFVPLILAFGAVANVILNFVLIPVIGIEGAAIATMIGYIITNIINCFVLIKLKLIAITKRFIYAVLFTVIYFLGWRFLYKESMIIATIIAIAVTIAYGFLYKKEIIFLHNKIKEKGR